MQPSPNNEPQVSVQGDFSVTVKRTKVDVKTEAGSFLFAYHVDTHVIEVHKKGQTFKVVLSDLVEFSHTSERKTFRVIPDSVAHDAEDDMVSQEFE